MQSNKETNKLANFNKSGWKQMPAKRCLKIMNIIIVLNKNMLITKIN